MKTSKHKPSSPKPPRIGELVYLRNVGYPFDRTDDGHSSWEGASCVVVESDAQPGSVAAQMGMVCVRPLLSMRDHEGRGCDTMHFHYPEQVVRESRPWLRKHLKGLLKVREQLLTLRETMVKHLS